MVNAPAGTLQKATPNNRLRIHGAVLGCQRNTVNKFVHLLRRRVETESLTRPIIELDHDCLNLCITDGIEIIALGIAITDETIEVFV